MDLEDVLLYNGIEIHKGDKIKIIGKTELESKKSDIIGYFVGFREDGLVYVSEDKDTKWNSAYNIANYEIIKLD